MREGLTYEEIRNLIGDLTIRIRILELEVKDLTPPDPPPVSPGEEPR